MPNGRLTTWLILHNWQPDCSSERLIFIFVFTLHLVGCDQDWVGQGWNPIMGKAPPPKAV